MATVVDKLVIELGLDPKELQEGQRKALEAFAKTKDEATNTAKQIEAAGQKAADSIDRITKSALALFAVLLGTKSLGDFAGHITVVDANMGRLAANIGSSAQDFSVWQMAVERMGGTAEGASNSLQKARQQLYDFRWNNTTPQDIISLGAMAHVKIDFLHGNDAYLASVAAAANKLGQTDRPDAYSRLNDAGLGDLASVMIAHGGAGLQPYLNTLKPLAPTDTTIAAMQDLLTKWIALQQQITAFATKVLGDLEPTLTALIQKFSDWLSNSQNLQKVEDAISKIGDSLPGIADSFVRIATAIIGIIQAWGGNASPAAAYAGNDLRSSEQRYRDFFNSRTDHGKYIEQSAIAHGIDPAIALRVAGHEGLGQGYSGDANTSFGDWQLHYGGLDPRFPHRGLGEEFTKATGLDAHDMTTWKAQTDFAMQWVSEHGWGDWSGAKAAGITGMAGVGKTGWWTGMPSLGAMNAGAQWSALTHNHNVSTRSSSADVKIGTLNVNAPHATGVTGIAAAVSSALKRSALTWAANGGPA